MKNVTKLLALAMVLFATQAFAQVKIGHININELVELMPERDSAVIQIQNFAKELDETMQGMQQEFNTKLQTYQQKNATWTAAILEAKTKELQDFEQRIQMFNQKAQQDMQQLQQTLFAPVYEKAGKAVDKIGAEGGFTYIIDMRTVVFKGEGGIDVLPLAKKELGIPESKVAPTQIPAQQAE